MVDYIKKMFLLDRLYINTIKANTKDYKLLIKCIKTNYSYSYDFIDDKLNIKIEY